MSRSGRDLPPKAAVVIVGGGVIGLSTAYHLARPGSRRRPGREGRVRLRFDLQGRRWGARAVLRRGQHRARRCAACGRSRRSEPRSTRRSTCTRSATCSCWTTPEHVEAFEKNVALQNELGVPSRMIDVAEAKALSPLIDTEGLLAAAYSPDRRALHPRSRRPRVRRARPAGTARGSCASCAVTGDRDRGRRAIVARRDRAAARSRPTRSSAPPAPGPASIGAMVGVDLPVTPLRRQILITEPMPGPGPGHAVHDRLRHLASTSTARAGPAAGHVRPARDPRLQARPVRRLAARARRGHRAPRPRRSAEVGIAGRLGRPLRDDARPQRAGRRGGRSRHRFLYATGFSGHGFLMGPASVR